MKKNMKFYNIKKRIYSGILALTMFATSFSSLSLPVMADNSVKPSGIDMPYHQGNDVKYFPATFYNYDPSYNGEFRFGNSWASHMGGDINGWTGSERVVTGIAKSDISNGFGLNKSCDYTLFTGGTSVQMPFIDEGNGYYTFDSDKYLVNMQCQENGKLALIDYSGDFYNAPDPEGNGFNQDFRFAPFSSIWYDAQNNQMNMPYPDYFFGYNFGFDFIMPKDGQMNGEDMTFTFRGDDDVWIYVDNKLALDLGGIHSAATGTINFATGKCYVNGAEQSDNNIGKLAVNQKHTLVMYYLERGGSASNFYVRFAQPEQSLENITTTYHYVDEDGGDPKDVPGDPVEFPTGETRTIPPSPLDDYDLIKVTIDDTPTTPNNDGSTTVTTTGKVDYYYVRNVYKMDEVHTYNDTTLGTSEDANKNSYRFYRSGSATTKAITEYNGNKDYKLVDIKVDGNSIGTANSTLTWTKDNFDAKRTPFTVQYIYERASEFNYTEQHVYVYNGEYKETDTKADGVKYTTETKTANADYTDSDNKTYVLTNISINGEDQTDLSKTKFDFTKQNVEIIYNYELYEKQFQVIHKYKNESETDYDPKNIYDSGLQTVNESQNTNQVLTRNGKNYELVAITVNDKPQDINYPNIMFDIRKMANPTVVVYEYKEVHALNVKHYFEGYEDPIEYNEKFTNYTQSTDDPTLKNDGYEYVLVKVVVNGQDDPDFSHGKTYKFYDKDGDPTIAYYYERAYKVSEKHVYNNSTTGNPDGTVVVADNDKYHGTYTANVKEEYNNNEYKLVSVTLNGNDVTDKNATSYTGKGGDLEFIFTYERVEPFNVTVEKIFYDDGYPESSPQHLVDSSSKKDGPFTDPQTYNTAKTGKTTKDGYTDKTFELTEVIVNNKSYKGSDIKDAYTFDDKMGDSKITYIYTYKSAFHVTETHYYYNRSEDPELVGTDKVAENKEYDSIYKAVPRPTYNKVTYTLYDVKVNGESIDPDLFKNGYEGHEFEYIDNAKIEFFYEKTDDYSVKVTHTFRDTGKEIDIESNSSDVPYTKPIKVSPLDNPKSKVDGYTDKTFELIEVIINGKTVDKNDWKKSYDVAKGKPETIEFVYGYETKFALTEKHNYSNLSTDDNYITTVHAKENYTGKITSSPIPVCEYDNKTYELVKVTVEYVDHPEDNKTIEGKNLDLFKNQTFEKENATINFYYELDEHFKYSVVDKFVDHGYSDGSKDFSEKRITDEEFKVSQKVEALTNPVRDGKTYVLEKILVNDEEVKSSDITITLNDLKDNKVTVEYVYGTKTTFDVTEVHHYTNKSTGDKNDDTKNINDFEDTYTSKPQPKNPEDKKDYTLVKVIDEDGNVITDKDKLKDYERKFDHKSGKIEYFYELDEEYTITEIHTYNDNGYG
ncbi:MAG: fibro-slime domain-containing protein, partial [Clostridia bacterium]|nr:fibro-slime domain-containing protein [Clostridia bacterium]